MTLSENLGGTHHQLSYACQVLTIFGKQTKTKTDYNDCYCSPIGEKGLVSMRWL